MSSENLNKSKESLLPSDYVIWIKCKGCEKEYHLLDGIFKHFSKYEGKNHCLPMYTCDELKALKCHQKVLTNHKSLCYHQTMLSRLNVKGVRKNIYLMDLELMHEFRLGPPAIPGHPQPSSAIPAHSWPSPHCRKHLRSIWLDFFEKLAST